MNPVIPAELAVLAQFGLNTAEDEKLLGCLLACDHEETASEFRSASAAAAEMALSLAPVAPPARAKARLMARLAPVNARGFEEPSKEVEVLREGTARLRATPIPGVSQKTLHHDAETGQLTSLVRIEPGYAFPVHRHYGVEQTYILEGSCHIGDVYLTKGDYQKAAAGLVHDAVISETGCTVLLVSSSKDEIMVR